MSQSSGKAKTNPPPVVRPPVPLPPAIDAGVQLLADIPIAGVGEDLLGRTPIAMRLVELACAEPVAAPRAVGLVGGSGSGKTSILRIAVELLTSRGDVAVVEVDATTHPGAQGVMSALGAHLTEFFESVGVADTADKLRDRLASYGGIVAGVARIAGVKVDIESTLRRSPEAVRAEIIEMTQEVGKRIVVVLDHVDRLAEKEMAATLDALRYYAAIPYVTIVLALDRRAIARRLADDDDRDPEIVERLLQVELAVPPADRVLLARVVASGLVQAAERLGRDVDDVLPLFDPDNATGALGLDLIQTARDAKRAVNALTATLPLMTDDSHAECLEILLRLLVPGLDGPRLDARRYITEPTARAHLLAELERVTEGHRRGGAARAALRALFERTAAVSE